MQVRNKFLGAAAAVLMGVSWSAVAQADGELNLLTWEGYADESFVKPFEEATGCKVSATYVGSNDDFPAKLAAGGGVYDMISPSIDTVEIMVKAGFVEPIDLGKVGAYDDVYAAFRDAGEKAGGGDVYSVPFTWGSIPFMYRVDKFDTPPTSLKDLWRDDLKGRVSLWDDKSAIYVAARANGDMNIYDLSADQLEAAKAKLIEQKPLVRKYWATAGELVDLYASGEVWISNTWGGYQSALLAEQGIEVKEFLPVEKAEGWMDSWMLVKGTPNEDCAYKFINMAIAEQGQCGVANITGYSVANPVAAKACMSAEQFSALHQDDLDYVSQLMMWESLGEKLEDYTNAWNAVKVQ